MKFTHLSKPSAIGASHRGQSKDIKINKRRRNKWIRRTPHDDKPITNRYSGWWY